MAYDGVISAKWGDLPNGAIKIILPNGAIKTILPNGTINIVMAIGTISGSCF